MISQTVEYALRAVVAIAQNNGRLYTAQRIAKITQVPAPYLSKLMQSLVRCGIASSRRGLHGGFALTKDPRELSIWEVMDALEPAKQFDQCPLGIKSHGARLCPLHQRLDRVMAMVEKLLRDTSIADVLAKPGSVTPLCEERPKAIDRRIDARRARKRGRKEK